MRDNITCKHGRDLEPTACPYCDEEKAQAVEALRERIAELEEICHHQGAMLDEIAAAAGFGVGDTYSAKAVIERLRTDDSDH